MKKILQISNYLYPNIGGIELVAKTISLAFKECDIEQKIICFNENAEDKDYICKRNETIHDYVEGIEVIRCGCFAKIFSQSLSLSYSNELKNIMEKFKPDIIIFHYPNPFVAHFLLKYKKKNFKLVLFWHLDITKQKILEKLFYFQSIFLLQRADAIISTSPNYIQGSYYLQKYKDKCTIIPVCIAEDKLKITKQIMEKANNLKNCYKNKVLCFALGRHVPYKGFKYLIDASKYLDDRFLIFIGGQGHLTKKLMRQAKGNNKIKFLGRLDDVDKLVYYLTCDIFTFPSITKNEAFGLALAEAMYFEKPTVTFNIPGSGVNYVSLNGITGIECKNRNAEQYAEAIKTLANNKDLAKEYGENAKKRVIDNFMFDKFKGKIIGLINSL